MSDFNRDIVPPMFLCARVILLIRIAVRSVISAMC